MKNRSLVRLIVLILGLLVAGLAPVPHRAVQMRIGSKKFTESVILGEMLRLLAEEAGLEAVHYREFGGTRIVFDALAAGEIDVYPEYTGTITAEIFAGQNVPNETTMRDLLREKGIGISKSLGFSNTYALALHAKAGRGVGNLADLRSQATARTAARADARIPRPRRRLAGAETALRSANNAMSSASTMTSPIANCWPAKSTSSMFTRPMP